MASVAAACGPGEETKPGPIPASGGGGNGGGGNGGGGNGGVGGGPGCPENATRDCSVTLGQHDNILSCFEGVQACKGGEWGPCTNGAETERPAPRPRRSDRDGARGAPPGQHTMVLGGAVADCINNPCDPTCQVFEEVPGTPLESPPQNLLAPWQTGSYGNLPPTIADLGTDEPCVKGEDCQFDQYCENPPSGTCSHHKCVTGVGLQTSCDPCVSDICGTDPSCCSPGVGLPACSHDLCTIGVALKQTVAPALPCDPCVNTICADPTYAACCNTSNGYWTEDCVAAVTSVCGKSCGDWTQGCVDQVATRCGATCLTDPGPPACGHDKCYLGPSLDSACDPCVADVCAIDPFCCSAGGSWDGKCLQEVASECGEQCPTRGNCVPWLPTQVDPACAPFDLTVGVGCTVAGAPQVPVCNHGQANAPAGLPIVVLPAAPVQIPSCYPALAGGTTVFTPSLIEPGDCIDVALPAGTPDGSQVIANPFGAVGYSSSECHCSNNWSVVTSATGACGTPSCAGASAFAKLKKIKLFITVDKSASQDFVMSGLPGSPTRWSQLKGALTGFITDPGSDEVGVWMRFWPYNVDGGCPAVYPFGCSATGGCRTANADVADIASAANETTLLNALNAVIPSGNTPMFPALDGALQAATTYQTANPDVATAVLMITDGDPTQCSTGVPAISSLAASAFSAYGVRTYMIGIAEVDQTTVEIIAGAGGGKSFFVDAGLGVPIQQQVLAALNSIKQDFVSCTLDLPNQDIFDPSKAVLTYTPNAGVPINVAQVANLAACGGASGWYYDDPADPASITMCPKLCEALKTDVNGAIELKIECTSQYLPETFKYEYEAACPQGTVPQWGYLAYTTQTPGDSKVDFRVHTADTNSFGPAPATVLTTAQAAPDTQVCAMGGPAPCPIDLYTGLGGLPEARRKWLQLVMDVQPTSDTNQTPQIADWQVTYSCPDAE